MIQAGQTQHTMGAIVFIYILLLDTLFFSNAAEFDCLTPTGIPSHCVSITKCEKLKELIRGNPHEREYIKKWHCGFDSDIPRVCCPPSPPKNKCVTPKGKAGQCIKLSSCSSMKVLLQEPVPLQNIQTITRAKCNVDDDNAVYVCCDDETEGPITDATEKQPTPVVTTEVNVPINNNSNDTMYKYNDEDCELNTKLPKPDSDCCGIEAANDNRITGGNQTAIDQYPWLVLLEYKSERTLCGGSLISRRYVLTAAHCLVTADNKPRNPKSVRVGEYNLKNPGIDCVEVEGDGHDCNEGAISITIEESFIHPEFQTSKTIYQANDIALLRLAKEAPFTEFIRPICLPTAEPPKNPSVDLRLFVAGWGAINETVEKSVEKMHVDLPLYNEQDCLKRYSVMKKSILWDKQMCAGGEEGKDSCQGDSGGPLMYLNGKNFEIMGIISFGVKQCGVNGNPSVYTKVHSYLDWIKSHITE